MKFIFLFIFSSSFLSIAKASQCNEVLSTSSVENAQNFINYFDAVFKGFDETVILALEQIIKTIDGNRSIVSSVSELEASQSSLNLLRRSTFNKLIERLDFGGASDLSYIREWATKKIKDLSNLEDERRDASNTTQKTFKEAIFHLIKAGVFDSNVGFGTDHDKSPVELLQDFEMQSTHVSRGQWHELMGTYMASERGLLPYEVQNHPVVNITVFSAMEYANRLSIKEGYEPVYNFSEMDLTGSAENGNLDAKRGSSGRLLINAADENIYHTEGYRLPTVAEYYMVLSNRNTLDNEALITLSKGQDSMGYFSSNLQAFPLYSIENGLHPPFFTNGNNFYDLMGNVRAFTTEGGYRGLTFFEGLDPFRPLNIGADGSNVAIIGSLPVSSTNPYNPEFFDTKTVSINHRDVGIGFRLVRTASP